MYVCVYAMYVCMLCMCVYIYTHTYIAYRYDKGLHVGATSPGPG